MAERNDAPVCAACKSTMERQITVPHGYMGADWSNENNGRGRFMPQLAKKYQEKNGDWTYNQKDPKAFHKSQRSAVEECSRRELSVTKA